MVFSPCLPPCILLPSLPPSPSFLPSFFCLLSHHSFNRSLIFKDWGVPQYYRANVGTPCHECCWASLPPSVAAKDTVSTWRGEDDACNSWARTSQEEECPLRWWSPSAGGWINMMISLGDLVSGEQLMRLRSGKATGWMEREVHFVSINSVISNTSCHTQGLKPLS